MNENVIRCVDVIARHGECFVVIERLTHPCGLALPGGKREPDEADEQCAIREFKEETGMDLVVTGHGARYDAPGRDPRGAYVSTVIRGIAYGASHGESGKTRVVLMTATEIISRRSEFIADHFAMFEDARVLR